MPTRCSVCNICCVDAGAFHQGESVGDANRPNYFYHLHWCLLPSYLRSAAGHGSAADSSKHRFFQNLGCYSPALQVNSKSTLVPNTHQTGVHHSGLSLHCPLPSRALPLTQPWYSTHFHAYKSVSGSGILHCDKQSGLTANLGNIVQR